MSWSSLADRKRIMLEDMGGCCGGDGGGGGDAGAVPNEVGADGFQASADPVGPRAGYDPLLGKAMKKRKESRTRRAMKEGYKKRSESDHDRMNDAALRHDTAHQQATNTSKLSYEGDKITKEIANARMDPEGYAREKQEKEKENRKRGRK